MAQLGLVRGGSPFRQSSRDPHVRVKANSNNPDYSLSKRKGDPTDSENFLKYGERLSPAKIPGTELGNVTLEDGTQIDAGRAMMKTTWKTELHGPLASAYEEGKTASRPDVWFDKNRNSGFCDTTSELSRFLEKHDIQTMLFAGVNTD
jgi:nicotinamidase-related amidase